MHTFLTAPPDQDMQASEKRSAMDLLNMSAFPKNSDIVLHIPAVGLAYELLDKPFLEPAFLETFFINFPWHLALLRSYPTIGSISLSYFFLFRLLSLRNLPQDNPRWSDEAKSAFSQLLDKVVEKVRALREYLVSSYLTSFLGGGNKGKKFTRPQI